MQEGEGGIKRDGWRFLTKTGLLNGRRVIDSTWEKYDKSRESIVTAQKIFALFNARLIYQ
jgi:hypothetical protein